MFRRLGVVVLLVSGLIATAPAGAQVPVDEPLFAVTVEQRRPVEVLDVP